MEKRFAVQVCGIEITKKDLSVRTNHRPRLPLSTNPTEQITCLVLETIRSKYTPLLKPSAYHKLGSWINDIIHEREKCVHNNFAKTALKW